LLIRNTSIDFEWAHSYSWVKLPRALNEPILDKDNRRWPWLSPNLLMRKSIGRSMMKTIDELKSHSYSWEQLPITLNGPILAHQVNCRWPWMGSILLIVKVVDRSEWAHSYPRG
jgi:hypothetical protein